MTIKNTAKIVKKILQEQPETRGNDYLLWLEVIKGEGNYSQMTVSDFLEWAKVMKIPCFETVSRARRKLQAKYPELRATKPVQEARAEKEVEYIEFARSEAI